MQSVLKDLSKFTIPRRLLIVPSRRKFQSLHDILQGIQPPIAQADKQLPGKIWLGG
jgi:hypothetical protein